MKKKILDNYKNIEEIKTMSIDELLQFSSEIREFIIDNVSKTGGHLASNLGVVELTLSLYNVFNFYEDKLVWDVGHQSYVHKILTGRKDDFHTLRQLGGLSGFPKSQESSFDMFETGHSSTSISAALGMARARDLKGENYEVVSVIGDGALTGGMALEALNDMGDKKNNIIVVLNDNEMSISKNVGAISSYLSYMRSNESYNKLKEDFNQTLRKTSVGSEVADSLKKIKGSIKQIVVPGMFFENMGIKYLGPIDGHNIKELSRVLSKARNIKGPKIIHVITKKGKGYEFAEKYPNLYHGVAPFNSISGESSGKSMLTYSKVFGEEMINLTKERDDIVAISAAMPEGTGLNKYAKMFPNRFFDVGIAEQHAVTLSAGMAKAGIKPVVAIYSTFLQRAYDQIIHDVCIQKLPVIFAIDRAGIVGQDGETHQGVFDLSYLSHIPNMTILSPKCLDDLKLMLRWSVDQQFPIAIRYPRGGDIENCQLTKMNTLIKGKWETIHKAGNIAVIATGKMVQHAVMVKNNLGKMGIDISVINACFVKPIDKELINSLLEENFKIVTIEDNVINGGLGSLVNQYIISLNKKPVILNIGYKDEFIPQGKVEQLYKLHGLDVQSLQEKIMKLI